MEINYVGLPTPWPITFINVAISLFGLFAATKLRLTWLNMLIFTFSFFRSFMNLIASFRSLAVHGISGFYYPALIFLLTMDATCFSSVLEGFGSSFLIPKNGVKNLVTFLLACFLCYISSFFSILWIPVALGIYASKCNFASSTQFITSCAQVPVTPAGTLVSCLEQSNGTYSCYLG